MSAKPKYYLSVLGRLVFVLLALVVPVICVIGSAGSTDGEFDTRRILTWICCLAGLLGLLAFEGYMVRGRVLGLLIDERNRFSLSRLQMTLWTVLVTTTLYVVFMTGVVRDTGTWSALDVTIDPNLVVLMGFSVASFIASPVALSIKAQQPSDPVSLEKTGAKLEAMQSLNRRPHAIGRVLVKGAPNDARLGDLIRGEDVGNANVVDLPRTQMLIVTAVVFLSYSALVAKLLAYGAAQIQSIPALSTTVLMLTLVSHGGYIAGKLTPSLANSDAGGQRSARVQQINQQAADIASDLQMQAAKRAPGDPSFPVLQNALTLARSTASDAAMLIQSAGPAGPQPSDIANLEGRLAALQAGTASLTKAAGGSQSLALDSASATIVDAVQRKLQVQGYAVSRTGIVDVATGRAIGQELDRLGIKREQLHPRAFRFFEELLPLIGRKV